MAPLLLRPLRIDETDAAAAIARRAMRTVPCFQEGLHTPEEDRAFWLSHVFTACEILGAYADGRLLGQVAVGQGWVHHLHVDPHWQGRGIGTALLGAVQERLDDIQLWTFQANAGARRFYERQGFIAVELTDGADNEEKEPDVRYRWLR
ncbi:MAG: GNAT family N-acetyltransferase [Sphingomonadales bacterium]|nr:GNAT family N-acetyltransferase [Sphingomonadales bacterium]